MSPTEGAQVRPKRCACPLTGVAVHLTPAISIIIPRPLMDTVANSRRARMTPPVALPFISIRPRAASRDILRDQGRAGARVGMVADPQRSLGAAVCSRRRFSSGGYNNPRRPDNGRQGNGLGHGEQTPLGVAAVRTPQAIRVEMPLEPKRAGDVIQ
jgi:hypothetical protein